MSLNLKCTVRLNRRWASEIDATLIAFVPAAKIAPHTRTVTGLSELDTISTDCIVQLRSFDYGKLYQVPLDCVTITQE